MVGLTGEQAWAELDGAHEFNTELLELIKQLRKNGLKVGLLSNTDTSLHGFLKEHGVHDLFDVVLTSGEMAGITAPKPDPAFYIYAVVKLNATPRQVVFFDDKPSNIDGAKQAGIEAAFVFTTVEQCQADLKLVCVQV